MNKNTFMTLLNVSADAAWAYVQTECKGTYDDAMKKLYSGSGNLIKRVEDIKKLGIKSNKEINPKLVDKSNNSI